MLADPAVLATLHARCFTVPRPWSADEFGGLLSDKNCVVLNDTSGFAIARVVLDEAELLTICIAPESQNQGHGARLLKALHKLIVAKGVQSVFLEVAQNNHPARRLYASSGYIDAGIRRDYYQFSGKAAVHALVLRCGL